MNAHLTYPDDDQCEVCDFDQVEFRPDEVGSLSNVGTVTKIYPRKKAVRVRYENPNWRWKPTYKSATVPIANLTLIQRDG